MFGLNKISRVTRLNELTDFEGESYQLLLLERQAPDAADAFFDQLMQSCFEVIAKISKINAEADIRNHLTPVVSSTLQKHPFYDNWIVDMASICRKFCDMQGNNATGFWLGTKRSCARYHVDNVPLRALVTYAGKGTEYLPDDAANRQAYEKGKPNKDIVKDKSAIQFMNSWDVAIFKGGSGGLLHRSPDEALHGASVMMRLDYPYFVNNIMNKRTIMRP